MDPIETMNNVEKRAKEAGIPLVELMAEAKVSYSTFTRMKNGETQPLLKTVNKITGALERMIANSAAGDGRCAG